MGKRKNIPPALRSSVLLDNQHACCICGKGGVQIHHIDSDPLNNDSMNLAVLCMDHHGEATAPKGLTAKLNPEEIAKYKDRWEKACRDRIQKAARARNAFFMVDYKNAERIRQLFSQLSSVEYEYSFQCLSSELKEESQLRKQQGYDISIEPTIIWSSNVECLLPSIRKGEPHPQIFNGLKGHPKDSLLPSAPPFSDVRISLFDIWCQLMVRALVAVRKPYIMTDLLLLEAPLNCGLSGNLVAFNGYLKGSIAPPDEWRNVPVSETTLSVSNDMSILSTRLILKTHYIYSITGATCLEGGRSSGLLMLRSIDSVEQRNGKREITYSCTPLIIGSGGDKMLEIP